MSAYHGSGLWLCLSSEGRVSDDGLVACRQCACLLGRLPRESSMRCIQSSQLFRVGQNILKKIKVDVFQALHDAIRFRELVFGMGVGYSQAF